MAQSNTEIRQLIERHLGGAWRSLCIEPERDGMGNPYTIRPEYIGNDDAATHLQSEVMPYETAKALQRAVMDFSHACMPSLEKQPNDTGVLRLNIQKARMLAGHESFLHRTEQRSLRARLEAGELPQAERGR